MSCHLLKQNSILIMKGGFKLNQIKIGKFIKDLRKEKGVTQEQFAEILGVSNRTISRWETGSNMPDISLLIEIAKYFEVSIVEIINGERNSEKMNDKTREVAETLSDYASAEKEKMVKEIRNYSIMGAVGIVLYSILRYSGLIMNNAFFEKIALVCEIQIYISVIITLAHTTGILNRLQRNQKVSNFHTKLKNMPHIVKIIVAAVIALLVSTLIKLFLDNVM